MQPQQKALPGSYYAKLIGVSILCVVAFALIFMEIFDIFHPVDIVPVNAAIHLARLIFVVLLFIGACVVSWYVMRFERAKALGESRAMPRWILFPTRWTLKNAVILFLLWFTGSVIFQILCPVTAPLDMAWIIISASLYASLMTFAAWAGHRRRVKSQIFVS